MIPPTSPSPAAARASRVGAFVGLAVWTLVMAGGFRVLVEYELRAGPSAAPLTHWPVDTSLRFDPTRANFVMFAHPQCPCSRASMAELAVIMTRCPQQIHATVCFLSPDGEAADWTHSALWRAASAIHGVDVVADRDGQISERFGSATSGQVFLFNGDGRQLFSGGITGARGHEGENRGRNLVIALARGEMCDVTATPVYGCSLHDAPMAADSEGTRE